jgi:hypothetical protein
MVKGKKKRRRHYKSGTLKISKCEKVIEYRSGWEKEVAELLDADPLVLKIEYESIVIPYVTNKRTRKVRKYFPDFLVTFTDGSRLVLEVKRDDKLNSKLVTTKKEAAVSYLRSQTPPIEYKIWIRKDIDSYKRLLESKTERDPQTEPTRINAETTQEVIQGSKTDIRSTEDQRLLLEAYKKCSSKKKKKK